MIWISCCESNESKRKAAGTGGLLFDNPKTNLTYEKNLFFIISNIVPKRYKGKINFFNKKFNI
ncbi:MAG TPA: hypothetical protein DFI01_05360 [Bacteroidales bacterium]|nr:hypothetical protein [Bacteroidales bacterium]